MNIIGKFSVFCLMLFASAMPCIADACDLQKEISHRDKFYDIAEWNGSLYIAGYPGHLLKSLDSGQTWQEISTGSRAAFFSFTYFDDKVALISGPKGLILRSEDGGASWVKMETGTEIPIFEVKALQGTSHAWAVGHFNTILHSSDSGRTWQFQQYAIPEDQEDEPGLNGIFIVNENKVWIVGEFGTVLTTDDGGANWRLIASVSGNPLYDVLFIDDGRTGFAVGAEGQVFETGDYGITWRNRSVETNLHLFSVFRLNGKIYVSGQDGIFAELDDIKEGLWKVSRTGVYTWLDSVYFVSPELGFAAGGRGSILKTTNGGQTWVRLSGR